MKPLVVDVLLLEREGIIGREDRVESRLERALDRRDVGVLGVSVVVLEAKESVLDFLVRHFLHYAPRKVHGKDVTIGIDHGEFGLQLEKGEIVLDVGDGLLDGFDRFAT